MDIILDLTRLPKEVLFILELLKDDNKEMIQKKQVELCKEIDWGSFLEYAIHHRVFPLLYSNIKVLDQNLVPALVTQRLTEQYKQNTFRMLQLTAEMEQISKSFTEKTINTLFLKGPAIAQDLYGDISLRTSSDLDLLIPIECLDEVVKILLKQGYNQTEFIDSIFKEWKWKSHHITFYHPNKNLKVEVHWRLGPGPGKETSFQELWSRKRKSSLTKYPVYFLGKEDLFHYLVTHGARHGWFRLRWLIDVQQMFKQLLDWKLIYKLFKSSYNVDIFGQAIILVSNLLNTKMIKKYEFCFRENHVKELAEKVIYFIARRENLHTSPLPQEISIFYYKYLYLLKSKRQRILFNISRIHPNYLDAKTLWLPKQLHFLYFVLHPFLWIWRKLKQSVLF